MDNNGLVSDIIFHFNTNGKYKKYVLDKVTDSAEYTDTLQYESAIGVKISFSITQLINLRILYIVAVYLIKPHAICLYTFFIDVSCLYCEIAEQTKLAWFYYIIYYDNTVQNTRTYIGGYNIN